MDYSKKSKLELIKELSILDKKLRKEREHSKKTKNEVADRNRIESQLKQNSEEYRKLINLLPDSVIIHVNQEIVFANPSALKLIGVKNIKAIKGRSIFPYLLPEYVNGIKNEIKKVKQGIDVPFMEAEIKKVDGKIVDVEIKGISLTYNGKPAILIVIHDNTIKKERDMYYSIIDNKSSNGSIFVKSKYQFVKVNTNDIYFVEALGDYVIINTADKKYTVHSTMKNFADKLPPRDFARAHRSYIVRLDRIMAIEYPNIIIEHSKKYIPIGNSYRKELMSRLKLV
ncbi:MAG: LytTR family transcriptional regulator DNA-binding domain-containing protein [Bacteroidia bacterium]|nr:LytTR family transcriptional regulator DNA-binding domain-containing protein [Bacteroidia bacterium]